MAASTAAPATKTVPKKTTKASKEKKPTSTKASHPPYFQMIKEALLALHEKGGSSPYAIAKFVEENHKADLPGHFKKILSLQLKNSVVKGKLIKVKASYKLSDASKKETSEKKAVLKKPKATTKPATKATPKATTTKAATKAAPAVSKVKAVKKSEPKKKAVKAGKKAGVKKATKSTPVKRKQPKSIKSSAAKKAKKA